MFESYNIKIKICLVGDSSVGKTSLVRRYVLDIYDDKYISTLGTKVSKKQMIIKKMNKNFKLTLSIWDVLGQKDFKNIHDMSFKCAKGALLVCDLTRKETFKNISIWESRVKKVAGEIPIVILTNKSDLTDEYAITEANIQLYSAQFNIPFFMTSAKYGDNVIKSFYKIGDLVIKKIIEESDKR